MSCCCCRSPFLSDLAGPVFLDRQAKETGRLDRGPPHGLGLKVGITGAAAKPNKAAGPDKVHPRFIKKLGPTALNFILTLFNTVWRTAKVPQAWRIADIRPILKKGKDPQNTSSYRPISLTSAMGKLMERLVTNRLVYILESKGLITKNQAGFRAGRSTEDQLLRLSQMVSDGFQEKPMKRTVLALFDYSKAYDTV